MRVLRNHLASLVDCIQEMQSCVQSSMLKEVRLKVIVDYKRLRRRHVLLSRIILTRTRTSSRLSTILQAAGVDIDGCNAGLGGASSETDDSGTCQTYRDTGATLLLNIFWTDFASYRGLVQPSYYYAPQLIAGSSFKQYVPFYNSYRSQRTLLNAHGIRIAVLLDGEFHIFNAVSFLITMTTAVGLLAVATTIVDLLMLYVLPEKRRYQEAKYERTEEFEGRDIVSSAVAGLNQLVSRDDHENIETTLDDERRAALDPLLDDNSLSNSVI